MIDEILSVRVHGTVLAYHCITSVEQGAIKIIPPMIRECIHAFKASSMTKIICFQPSNGKKVQSAIQGWCGIGSYCISKGKDKIRNKSKWHSRKQVLSLTQM